MSLECVWEGDEDGGGGMGTTTTRTCTPGPDLDRKHLFRRHVFK